MVYALVVLFVSSGRGDEHQAAEWIHKAYRFSQRSQHRNPLLGLVVPLERMLQAPDAVLPAFEPLLDDEDPWVRALARLHARQDADHARPGRPGRGRVSRDGARRVPGARRTVRDLVRPDRAGGPHRHARRVRRCVRVLRTGDRGRHRGRRHRGRHPDAVAAGPAVLAAGRRGRQRGRHRRGASGARNGSPGRTRWPSWPCRRRNSLVGAATPRRRASNSASRPTLLGDEAEQANIRAVTHDLLGYLADDLGEARAHRAAACQAAAEAGHAPLIAQVLVGVADLALRRDQYEQAARLLAASAGVRGLPDRSHPDAARIERDSAAPPRRRTVRRGDAGGHADELVSAGRGHARFLNVESAHRYPTSGDPDAPGDGDDRVAG